MSLISFSCPMVFPFCYEPYCFLLLILIAIIYVSVVCLVVFMLDSSNRHMSMAVRRGGEADLSSCGAL